MTIGRDQPFWPKDDLLGTIHEERRKFDEVLKMVPPERMTEPGVGGAEWSVKDVIAHIAWGDRENGGVLRERALVGSDLWKLNDDDRNAAVFAEQRHRALDDVLHDYRDSFQALMRAMETATDEDLNDPARIRNIPPGWRPWRILYDPHHYEQHRADIEQWLARSGAQTRRDRYDTRA